MWTRCADALTNVLESMDAKTFEEVVVKNPDRMPQALRLGAVAAMRKIIEGTLDHPSRLQIALKLIKLGETGQEDVAKNAVAELPSGDGHRLDLHFIRLALEMLHDLDPALTGRWVAARTAEGIL